MSLSRIGHCCSTERMVLASLLARAVALEAPRALWWALGLGFFYFIFTFITRQIQLNLLDSFKGTPYEPIINALAGGQNPTGNAVFLSLLMNFIPLLITAMAVTQVNGWERVEAEGQLDLVLATPQTRAKALLTRMGAAAVGQALVLAVTFVAILIAAAIAGLTLDNGKLAQATLGALPWGLVVLSAGYLARHLDPSLAAHHRALARAGDLLWHRTRRRRRWLARVGQESLDLLVLRQSAPYWPQLDSRCRPPWGERRLHGSGGLGLRGEGYWSAGPSCPTWGRRFGRGRRRQAAVAS